MNDATMAAAVLYGKEDVRLERIPVPPVGPGEVRVRVRAALTCGTDVKVWRRGYHAKMIVPPAVFGHEFAGDIDAVGEGTERWRPGMRVVAANSAPCGQCFYCHRDHPQLCEDLLFVNGAYAEHIVLPERLVRVNLLEVPPHVSYAHAAVTEPLACVVNGVQQTDVQPGDTVAVIGEGQIGLMFVRLCKLAGARVISVGRIAERLALAAQMGADVLINADDHDDVVAAVRAQTNGGRGPDRVVECVGTPATWQSAVAMARKAGTVNLFGGCPADTTVTIDTGRIHYDELTIKGTFHHTPATVRRALELVADGTFPAHVVVGDSAPLAELPAVLRRLALGASVTKVAITV